MRDPLKLINITSIYEKFDVPDNIIRHMTKVAGICLFFAEKININNENDMIVAALCHDIMKLKGANHENKAGTYFKQLNFKRVAEIISKHRYTSIIDPDPRNRLNTIEEKIVYYADKRVLHDKIVTLESRLDDGRKRYPLVHGELENDKLTEQKILQLQAELCSKAGINPTDICNESIEPFLAKIKHQYSLAWQ